MKAKRSLHTVLVHGLTRVLALRKDCYGWPNNTGAVTVGERFLRFGKVGSSDWLGLTSDGKMLCFECKTGEGRQTFHQRQFQEQIEAMGGRYYVIRSIPEALKILDDLKLLQPAI